MLFFRTNHDTVNLAITDENGMASLCNAVGKPIFAANCETRYGVFGMVEEIVCSVKVKLMQKIDSNFIRGSSRSS